MSTTKMVLVVRRDLKMRRGKECSQTAHAAMAFLTRRLVDITYDYGEETHALALSDVEQEWLNNSFTKICVRVDSEDELLGVHQAALDAGIESHLIQDNGTTEFGGVPTYTCVAIGPDFSERLDPVTSHLKLL